MRRSGTRVVLVGAARALRWAPQSRCNAVACVERWASDRWMSSTKRNGVPSGVNTSNPFEIKFHVDDAATDVTGLVVDGASAHGDQVSSSFEKEINLFHSEMVGVFGSEPEEYRDGGDQPTSSPPSSGEAAASLSQAFPHGFRPAVRSTGSRVATSAVPASPTPSRPRARVQSAENAESVVLIHGPCTFVHGSWVGSNDQWSSDEVELMVEEIGDAHGLAVAQHHSNHEGQILDWLLTTSPGDKIILNWNGRLADSPSVFRALASIRAFVVVLTPLDNELGPLPPSVKGVIAGFGTRSLALAVAACK